MIQYTINAREKIEAAESGIKCIEDEIIIRCLAAAIDPWTLPEDWQLEEDSDDPILTVLDSFMRRKRFAEQWIEQNKQK